MRRFAGTIFLISLLALNIAPRAALAQAAASNETVATSATEAWLAPIALTAHAARHEPRAARPVVVNTRPILTRVVRIAVNLLAGTAFGTIGAAYGAGSGAVVGLLVSPACGYYPLGCVTTGLVIGAVSATIVAIPFGLMLAGSLLDGRGSWGFTYLGTVIGAALGFGVVALGQGSTEAILTGATLPLIGGIVAYELTSLSAGIEAPGGAHGSAAHAMHFRASLRPSIAAALAGSGAIFMVSGAF